MIRKRHPGIEVLAALWFLLLGSGPALALLDNGVDPRHLGKGDWIWQMSAMEANLGVSSVQAVIDFEKAHGMQFLIVKCSDGGQWGSYYWPQFNTDLITRCHAAGIKIFGFGYVYGSSLGSGQVQGEINAAVGCMGVKDSSGVPMDGFMIDAEIEYNGRPNDALAYCQGIRAKFPTRFLAHSPYPVPSYNVDFPYIEFGKYCDAVFTQDYWYDQFSGSGGKTPTAMLNLENSDFCYWEGVWTSNGHADSVKPRYPIGQGFQGRSPQQIPGSKLTEFYNAVKAASACSAAGTYQGISFWSGQHHTADMWNAIAAMTFDVSPVITNQPVSATNCQGSTATFTVLAGPSPLAYQWRKNASPISGATLSAYTLTGITTNSAGTYDVVITNNVGTTNSVPATLTVSVPPAITGQPQSQYVCQGGNASFCVTATGTPLYYTWQFNGTNLSASQSCYSLSNVRATKAGDYTVVVSNSCGAVTSAVAKLTITVPPDIVAQPVSLVVTQGVTALFCVTASDGSFPTYRWQLNGANQSATGNCYSLGNVHCNKGGAYTVVVSNNCSVLTSAVAWLTVVMPLADQTAVSGTNIAFTVNTCGGNPSLTYQWLKDGTNLSSVNGSAITPNLTLSNVSPGDAGIYTVMMSNDAGSSAGVSAFLSILQPAPGHFDRVRLLADGTLQLDMSGQSGCTYALEASSNWQGWSSLTTLTNTSGLFHYTDLAATNGSQRFYRLRFDP